MRHARAQLARESWLSAVWRAAGVALRGAGRREEDRVCLPEDGHVWEEQDGASGARGEVLAVRADEVRHAVLGAARGRAVDWAACDRHQQVWHAVAHRHLLAENLVVQLRRVVAADRLVARREDDRVGAHLAAVAQHQARRRERGDGVDARVDERNGAAPDALDEAAVVVTAARAVNRLARGRQRVRVSLAEEAEPHPLAQ
mmetsp:Transcript_13801/g.44220  ORF Transcript_13801/g.44220 Transcript_13801/m.44220 type:complete len:201 (+) Transcript_13801:690-1292(+)